MDASGHLTITNALRYTGLTPGVDMPNFPAAPGAGWKHESVALRTNPPSGLDADRWWLWVHGDGGQPGMLAPSNWSRDITGGTQVPDSFSMMQWEFQLHQSGGGYNTNWRTTQPYYAPGLSSNGGVLTNNGIVTPWRSCQHMHVYCDLIDKHIFHRAGERAGNYTQAEMLEYFGSASLQNEGVLTWDCATRTWTVEVDHDVISGEHMMWNGNINKVMSDLNQAGPEYRYYPMGSTDPADYKNDNWCDIQLLDPITFAVTHLYFPATTPLGGTQNPPATAFDEDSNVIFNAYRSAGLDPAIMNRMIEINLTSETMGYPISTPFHGGVVSGQVAGLVGWSDANGNNMYPGSYCIAYSKTGRAVVVYGGVKNHQTESGLGGYINSHFVAKKRGNHQYASLKPTADSVNPPPPNTLSLVVSDPIQGCDYIIMGQHICEPASPDPSDPNGQITPYSADGSWDAATRPVYPVYKVEWMDGVEECLESL